MPKLENGMPEPFKNRFNESMIRLMASHLKKAGSHFDADAFLARALEGLEALELKDRGLQLVDALEEGCPADFSKACDLMERSLHPEKGFSDEMDGAGVCAWAVMPMAEFVARHGMKDFDLSMKMLREFTIRFTSEFAVRPFLVAEPERALAMLHQWAVDDNFHVRRLASEGSRPRLPWGIRLSQFVEDPAPLFPILEKLKDDPEEYVRRSVANNLNDIAKDHPELVVDVARKWLVGADQKRKRLVKHACRTLIKNGHQGALSVFGYREPDLKLVRFDLSATDIEVGKELEISIELNSVGSEMQPLVIDYAIHHQKANGQLSPKVFKWKQVELFAGQSVALSKRHSLKPVTTRKYYPGLHRVELQINGKSFGMKDFTLRAS